MISSIYPKVDIFSLPHIIKFSVCRFLKPLEILQMSCTVSRRMTATILSSSDKKMHKDLLVRWMTRCVHQYGHWYPEIPVLVRFKIEAPHIKKQLLIDLAALDQQIRASELRDHMSLEIQRWSDQFKRVLSENSSLEIIMAHIGLLHEKLKDPITGVLLDHQALLGSDGETYHSETVKQFVRLTPSIYKNRSPLYGHRDSAIFTSISHQNVVFVIDWLKKRGAYLSSDQIESSFTPLKDLIARMRNSRGVRSSNDASSSSTADRATSSGRELLISTIARRKIAQRDNTPTISHQEEPEHKNEEIFGESKRSGFMHAEEGPSPTRTFRRRPLLPPSAAISSATSLPTPPVDINTRIQQLAERQRIRAAREEEELRNVTADFERSLAAGVGDVSHTFAPLHANIAMRREATMARLDEIEEENQEARAQLHATLGQLDQRLEEIRAQNAELNHLRRQVEAELGSTSGAMNQWGKTLDAAIAIQKEREATVVVQRKKSNGLGGWLLKAAFSVFASYVFGQVFAEALASFGIQGPTFWKGLINFKVIS